MLSLICERHGLQATEDAGEMLQAVLNNDPLYQRQKRRIERMEALLDALTDEESKLVELRYFKRLPYHPFQPVSKRDAKEESPNPSPRLSLPALPQNILPDSCRSR